jgi:hypothetical protein
MKSRLICVAGLLHFLATCALAQNPIPDTPQGFQHQYHSIFDAFQAHDATATETSLNSFAIPPDWFTQAFGPEHGADLARQYAAAFAEFKHFTVEKFASIEAIKAHMQIDPAEPTDVRSRPWTPAESAAPPRPPGLHGTPPPVWKFEIDCVLSGPGKGARLTSWIDSYVYIDGAFRYFGRPNKPFWKNGSPPPGPD